MIIDRLILHNGDKLSFQKVIYKDKKGKVKSKEMVEVSNRGIVDIIPYIPKLDAYVFIKEYRPTVEQYVIGFPAGKMEKGENIDEAAERELQEETGYIGEVIDIYPISYTSEGLSDEKLWTVWMDIDYDLDENKAPKQDLDNDEEIQVFVKKADEIKKWIESEHKSGVQLGGKTISFLIGKGLT